MLQEISTMKLIEHKNVPAFLEYHESAQYVKKNGQQYEVAAIVMEYLPNGDLFNYLVASGRGFPEEIARTFFGSLIESRSFFFFREHFLILSLAIGDLHDQGIAHRDLKVENLLFDTDFNLKVGDFGFAAKFWNNEKGFIPLKGRCGTRKYAAPEIYSKDPYNGAAVDVFSCGVVLFILITGYPPFKEANKNDLLYSKIVAKNYKDFWGFFENGLKAAFSEEFKDLINAMLAFEPSERPNIKDIKGHAWVCGPVLDSEELKESMSVLQEKVDALKDSEKKKRKERAAQKKANKMQEETVNAPFGFNGVQVN